MESQDPSIPSVLTIQDAFFMEPKRAPEKGGYQTHDGTEHWIKLLSRKFGLYLLEGECRWKTWMECGEEVLLNFSLPSIASSIYIVYEGLAGIPGVLGSNPLAEISKDWQN
jgi:hypothetical protein